MHNAVPPVTTVKACGPAVKLVFCAGSRHPSLIYGQDQFCGRLGVADPPTKSQGGLNLGITKQSMSNWAAKIPDHGKGGGQGQLYHYSGFIRKHYSISTSC